MKQVGAIITVTKENLYKIPIGQTGTIVVTFPAFDCADIDFGLPYGTKFMNMEDVDILTKQSDTSPASSCHCGSASCGSPKHSDWCPCYER